MNNARRKARAEKTQAEDQKLKQVDYYDLIVFVNIYTIWYINIILTKRKYSSVTSGFICGATNKGVGQADAADSHV